MLETLAESLAARELLLILDNCDHVLAPVAALAEALLRAAGVRIVSTSREPLGIRGECIVAVPSLSTPPRGGSWESALDSEAVRLFADRAAALDPGFALDRESADSVAQICRRLDGIPLALELAAARMTTLPADEILRRLDDRFRLLTGGSKTALPRHQTLSALFDWSHDLLSEPERALLRRLSVFAGGWTLDAVESVCAGGSIEDWMTVDLLSNLVQRSLVERDAGGTREGGKARYRMLETVRQYARDRLLESGEGEVIRRRHRSFFTALAEDLDQRLLGFGQKAALARFRVEHDNLLSALATEVKGQVDGETTLRLGGALGRFWGTEGFWTEGRRIYLEILSRPECGPRSSSRAKVCNWAGNLGTFMGDYDAGEALHEECLAIAREVGDAFYEASAYNNLGVVANYRGELERAEQLHRRSLELRSGLGQPWAVALSLYQLGTTHVRQRRLDAARPRLEEALEIMRKVGDGIAVAAALCSLGFLSLMEGDPAGARQRFEESLGMHRDHREAWGTALCLHGLGVALGRVGSTAEALASHRESLAIRLQIVDRQAVSTSLEAIGVLVATLQPELAVRLLGAAEAVRQRIRAGLSAWEMEDHDQATNRLRDVLGDERMATLWNQGRALSLEEAASATRQARPSASGR
jgi:predicted ATPase/Tfp pilus assembly protein PilF